MKHYIDNGVQGYFYWNTSLLEGGISTRGLAPELAGGRG